MEVKIETGTGKEMEKMRMEVWMTTKRDLRDDRDRDEDERGTR